MNQGAPPGDDDLRHNFVDNDVVGSVIGSDVFDLDRGALAQPFLAGLRRAEGQLSYGPVGVEFVAAAGDAVVAVVGGPTAVHAHQVAEDEGGHVGRLPKRRVQQMGQR